MRTLRAAGLDPVQSRHHPLLAAFARSSNGIFAGFAAAVVVLATGCQTTHRVKIDAINNPAKPAGSTYRLEIYDPSGGVDKELVAKAASSVHSALMASGLYQAPENVRPDMIVNAEFGVGPGEIKIDYKSAPSMNIGIGLYERREAKPVLVFEKYLILTAREPVPTNARPAPAKPANEPARGDELWSVRVSVEDPKRDLGPYLPALSSASVDYIGRNSGKEVYIKVDPDGKILSE